MYTVYRFVSCVNHYTVNICQYVYKCVYMYVQLCLKHVQ